MPIRISRDIPTLDAKRFLESNTTKIGESVRGATSDIRLGQGRGDTVNLPVSEELINSKLASKVTVENFYAADSTFREANIFKEIAMLTRNYILRTAPAAIEEQTKRQHKD